VRHAKKLGIEGKFLSQIALLVVDMYKETYSELEQNKEFIFTELEREEEKFSTTLQKGEHEFEKLLVNLLKGKSRVISGRIAFKLYDTFGFPIELTQELATEHGFSVDVKGFDEAFEKHQEVSRSTSGTFKGGLADHSDLTTALHTATHLLHQALRTVLGDHVGQKGSNITPERLRFDFTHPSPMTKEEIEEVERIVNDVISRDLPVSFQTMSVEEAKEKGAIAFFESKYGELVKVYSVGDFSKEVCGGPHVESTGSMGAFKIVKEQSSSAGVRRIKATLSK
jgi:alanyl-tRNA synthetase